MTSCDHQLIFFFFNDTATTEIYTLPYTTLFRSRPAHAPSGRPRRAGSGGPGPALGRGRSGHAGGRARRSEEHTSELQSQSNLVCRLLLEKKKQNNVIQ